jgi:myosin heavy subunit
MTSGTMRRSVITITLSPQMAADARDTLARTIYDKIFLDIIQKINAKSGTELLNSSANYRKKIGLLDIFGFEIFPLNSLEKLCIN